jgi:DNA-binding transcriptional ArsR family regulator
MNALTSPFRTPGFGDADARVLAAVLKILADPTRLRILALLHQHGPLLVAELMPDLKLSQATVSHHIKALESAGLVREEPVSGAREIVIDAVCQLAQMVDQTRDGRR